MFHPSILLKSDIKTITLFLPTIVKICKKNGSDSDASTRCGGGTLRESNGAASLVFGE